jgi:cytoskeletal protein CcmA (bactofilin family)
MNPVTATIVLLLLAGMLLLLPMLPAIFELHFKRDAHPLSVIQQYAGDIRHFAHSFRDYVHRLQHLLEECVASGKTFVASLPNGDECIFLGRGGTGHLLMPWLDKAVCRYVVVSSSDGTLPDGLTFLKETYALGNLAGGKGTTYRAILGEQNIRLREGSKVLRWAHAAASFSAGKNCDLFGRVSSEKEILLDAGCMFQRLNAPRIAAAPSDLDAAESQFAARVSSPDTPSAFSASRRALFDDDVEIRSGEVFVGNLVTRGHLRVGSGARVRGSAKSSAGMIIESGALIEGSLISAETMGIGPGCRIHGPVLAERSLTIASGTVCGEIDAPTTVSAPNIEVAEGVLVFGTLWARELGRVVPLQ